MEPAPLAAEEVKKLRHQVGDGELRDGGAVQHQRHRPADGVVGAGGVLGGFGAKVVTHAKSVIFQLAEMAVSRTLLVAILTRIGRLRRACDSG